MRQAVTDAHSTLLNVVGHQFQPHGVTMLGLLAESHISIHTWPESHYAAVDVFTCGDRVSPERACQSLVRDLRAESHHLQTLHRYGSQNERARTDSPKVLMETFEEINP